MQSYEIDILNQECKAVGPIGCPKSRPVKKTESELQHHKVEFTSILSMF